MNNPKLYREMSEPHATAAEVNASLQAFFDDLGELRKKHKLRDIVAIVNTSYLASDGIEEIDGGSWFGYGNSMNYEIMLAHTLGIVQTERQEMLARAMSAPLRKGGSTHG